MAFIDYSILSSFLVFAFSTTISPGLNNILTVLYTLRYNVKKAIIFRLGVIVSFPLMGFFTVLFLRPVLNTYEELEQVFVFAGALLLLYIGIKIVLSNPTVNNDTGIKYIGFFGAFSLQLINGKAWSMVFGASSVYTVSGVPLFTQAFTIYLGFLMANILCTIPWLVCAHIFKEKLIQPHIFRVVNGILGSFIILQALYPLFKYIDF